MLLWVLINAMLAFAVSWYFSAKFLAGAEKRMSSQTRQQRQAERDRVGSTFPLL